MTPYYDRAGITIYCGETLEVMAYLYEALRLIFDAIICDLPYGTTACSWDTIIPFEPLWENYKRLVKKSGAVVLFGSQPFTSKLVMSNLEWFRQEIIWNKGEGGNFANANKRILPAHENILLFSQKSPVYNPQFTNKPTENIRGARYDGSETVFYKNFQRVSSVNYKKDVSYPISVIRFPSQAAECNSAHRLHPTQKPVASSPISSEPTPTPARSSWITQWAAAQPS